MAMKPLRRALLRALASDGAGNAVAPATRGFFDPAQPNRGLEPSGSEGHRSRGESPAAPTPCATGEEHSSSLPIWSHGGSCLASEPLSTYPTSLTAPPALHHLPVAAQLRLSHRASTVRLGPSTELCGPNASPTTSQGRPVRFSPHTVFHSLRGGHAPAQARGFASVRVQVRDFASVPEQVRAFAASALSSPLRGPPSTWREQTYARTLPEYSRLARALLEVKKAHLTRDLYDDMMMDGIIPDRQVWHSLIVGCKRQRRLQDALFFFDEMKAWGVKPDTVLYNCLIEACGITGHVSHAFKIAEEMEVAGFKPKQRTYVAILSACGIAGKVEEALGVVQRMKAQGLHLDKFCYSALIAAYKNTLPLQPECKPMVFELLEQSRKLKDEPEGGQGEGEAAGIVTEDDDHESGSESESEVGGGGVLLDGGSLATGMLQDMRQVVYRAAIRALLYWRDMEGVKKVMAMCREDGMEPDLYSQVLMVQACLQTRDVETGLAVYDELIEKKGLVPSVRLQVGLMAGAIRKYTPEAMNAAKKLLADFERRGHFLTTKYGSHLLRLASKENKGDFSCAEALFDNIAAAARPPRRIQPHPVALSFFIEGLKRREVSPENERMVAAQELLAQARAGISGANSSEGFAYKHWKV